MAKNTVVQILAKQIKQIYEYRIDKNTFKGTVKVLKVVKVTDDYWNKMFILDNGQYLSQHDIIDFNRASDAEDGIKEGKTFYTLKKFSDFDKLCENLRNKTISTWENTIFKIQAEIRKVNSTRRQLKASLADAIKELERMQNAIWPKK